MVVEWSKNTQLAHVRIYTCAYARSIHTPPAILLLPPRCLIAQHYTILECFLEFQITLNLSSGYDYVIKSIMRQDMIHHPSTWVNGYLCFVKIEKISLLDNSKLSVNVLDTIIDGWTVSSHRSCMQPKLRAN